MTLRSGLFNAERFVDSGYISVPAYVGIFYELLLVSCIRRRFSKLNLLVGSILALYKSTLLVLVFRAVKYYQKSSQSSK